VLHGSGTDDPELEDYANSALLLSALWASKKKTRDSDIEILVEMTTEDVE